MEQIQRGMQDKTIRRKINEKVTKWIDSIEDDAVRKAVVGDVIVTGGCIASMAMGDKVNDYDIYFRTKETTIAVAQYYADQALSDGLIDYRSDVDVRVEMRTNIKGEEEERVLSFIQSSGVVGKAPENAEGEEIETQEEDCKYRVRFISENAITLSNSIQLITRFFGEPDEIHRNYDFVHACCYYDYGKNELAMPQEALRSMMSRTLVYRGSLYPICSLFRLRKFIKRGWKISAGQIFKIAHQISEIDLTDRETLREQLTGVDQLYFDQLVNALVSHNGHIDSTYVATIIDTMES
jgi:hypothetical protein